jgi:hypothetical protein
LLIYYKALRALQRSPGSSEGVREIAWRLAGQEKRRPSLFVRLWAAAGSTFQDCRATVSGKGAGAVSVRIESGVGVKIRILPMWKRA